MRKRIILLVVILVVGVGAWTGYSLFFKDAVATDNLLVSGNIEAHESVVSFKAVQSRVVELPFDEGQWVKAGTAAGAARRQRLSAAGRDQRGRSAACRNSNSLPRCRNSRPRMRRSANDNADLAQKNIDYDRSQKLWTEKIISGDQRDHTETALKESGAAMQRDRAMERSAQQDIAVAQANISNASENLELAKIMLGYTTLRAPFSGVILTRQTELGEVMQPGTPVVTLADLDHVWLRAYVAETDLGRIRWGQAATVHTDTYPDKAYPGQISFIASEAEFTPKSVETHKERVTLVYRIKIDVENPRHELKPGMPADATIHLGPLRCRAATAVDDKTGRRPRPGEGFPRRPRDRSSELRRRTRRNLRHRRTRRRGQDHDHAHPRRSACARRRRRDGRAMRRRRRPGRRQASHQLHAAALRPLRRSDGG